MKGLGFGGLLLFGDGVGFFGFVGSTVSFHEACDELESAESCEQQDERNQEIKASGKNVHSIELLERHDNSLDSSDLSLRSMYISRKKRKPNDGRSLSDNNGWFSEPFSDPVAQTVPSACVRRDNGVFVPLWRIENLI